MDRDPTEPTAGDSATGHLANVQQMLMLLKEEQEQQLFIPGIEVSATVTTLDAALDRLKQTAEILRRIKNDSQVLGAYQLQQQIERWL